MKLILDDNKKELIIDNKIYTLVFKEYSMDVDKTKHQLSKVSLDRLENVHPRLVEVIKKAIEYSPYDFTIVQGFRTDKYQNELYQQGRTKKGNIITYADGYKNKSNHQGKGDGYGYAIDFAIYDPSLPGKLDWNNIDKFKAVANHIMMVGKEDGLLLEWGGNWKKFKDYPHIELKGVIK